MLKKLVLMCCFIMVSSNGFSQEFLNYPGGKHYRATQTWNFICENYALSGILKAQVARTEKGGVLKLAVEVTDPEMYIGGTVYVFLNDFTVITCTDKGVREHSGKEAIAYYNLSLPEMDRLKTKAITDIRFVIKGKETAFSSKIGNFTAINKKNYFDGYDKTVRNSYETELEIRSLYP